MKRLVEALLRAEPAIATGLTLFIAVVLDLLSRPAEGFLALSIGLCAVVSDLVAYILKVFVFKPLYTGLGLQTLPLLGRGARPPGASRCGILSSGPKTKATSYGMPSGHSAQALAMLSIAFLIAPPDAGIGWHIAILVLGLSLIHI